MRRRRRSRMNCEPLTRDYVTIREYLAHLSATSDFVCEIVAGSNPPRPAIVYCSCSSLVPSRCFLGKLGQ